MLKFVPEIKGKYKNVPTPDYLINQKRWDLEVKRGISAELLWNNHTKNRQKILFLYHGMFFEWKGNQ